MIHMNSSIMYFLNANGNDSETWTQQNGQNWALQIDMNNNNTTFGGQITSWFVVVSTTNTDYLIVQQNYGSGAGASNTIRILLGLVLEHLQVFTGVILMMYCIIIRLMRILIYLRIIIWVELL